EPIREPLDQVVPLDTDLGLHFVYTLDGVYVPAVVLSPPGRGPFPAVMSVHGGSGGLGVSYLIEQVREQGMLFERLVAEGYVVCCTEGRMEHEDAYASGLPTILDHQDIVQLFRYVQHLEHVDPARVAIFGVSHGGEIQLKA